MTFIVHCDQIVRFIAPWETFQSLWQQLFCPKSYTFLVNFYREIIVVPLLWSFGDFLLVTLIHTYVKTFSSQNGRRG